jgi:alcohol dehydrogenase class IV
MGVGNDRIDELVEMALADPSCGGNPVPLSKENLRPILEEVIG